MNFKILTFCSLTNFFLVLESYGTVFITMTGVPGSSIVTISVSGSGVWIEGDQPLGQVAPADDVGWGGAWSGDFADGFDSGAGLNRGDGAPLVSGAIIMVVDEGTFPISEINFDSDNSFGGDDIGFSIDPQYFPQVGGSYSFSGSGLFDLNAMEPGVSFDNFTPGTYTTPGGVGNLGSTSASLTIVSVPEPQSFAILSLGCLTVLLRRCRPRRQSL